MTHEVPRGAQLVASRYLHLLAGPRGHLAFDSLAVQGYDISEREFGWLSEMVDGAPAPPDVDVAPFREAGLVLDAQLPGQQALDRLATARHQRTKERRGHFGTLRLAVTEKCNMACSYCFQQRLYPERQPTMTRETLVETMSWFIDQGSGSHLTVQYFGGEPLLEWDHIVHAHDMLQQALGDGRIAGFRETLTTNGTLLTQPRAAWMAARGFDVTVSFDGPPAENDRYRLLRSGRGTFGLAEAGLRRWTEAGGQPAILMTATRESLSELPRYVRWFVEESDIRPQVIGINSPQPTASGWETGGAELAEVIWEIWQYCDERGLVFHGPGTFIAGQLSRAVPRVDTCVDSGPDDQPSWPVYVSASGQRSLCVVHHQDRRVMAREDESTFDAGLRWHNLGSSVAEACDSCIASQLCGGPCAVERLLWRDRLSVDRCGLMRRMTELVLTEG